jgi:transcription elongation factor GreA
MPRVKLTREGQERLRATLQEAREKLLETEEFMRQQLLCKCDLDPISLRAAREKKAALEQRIDELEAVLADAKILPKDRAESVVDLGAFVTLAQEGADEEMLVQLVAPPEATVVEGSVARISDASPLGQRLLGRRVGEAVRVPLSGGRDAGYRVKDVRY